MARGTTESRAAGTAGAAAPARPRQGWQVRRRTFIPYLFVLPNMAVFALFTIYPALNGFNISFYDSSNGRTFEAVGTENYANILSDDDFFAALRQTLVFVVGFVVLSLLVSIALAVLLNAQQRGRGFYRAVFFLPTLLSPVVVGLVWNWVLERQNGLLNIALDAVGLGQPGWLVDPDLAMVAIIGVGLWTHTGFYVLIVLAGLQSIDANVYEAARMDGASAWQQLRSITLPLLGPTTLVVLILATIQGFQAFDFIYNLTGGGPVGSTVLMVQYVYERAFTNPVRYGLASAGAVVLFLIVLGFTLVNWLVGRKQDAA